MSRKKSTITPEERKLKEMSQVLLHLGIQSGEQDLKTLQKEESEKFNTIKVITDKFLPEYAISKKIRNVYKLDGFQVKPIAEMFDIRILSEEVLKNDDLTKKEVLEKYRKTDAEERAMSDDALRYLILSDGRFIHFTTEPDDKVLVHGGFLMDPSRSRCYPMGSSEAKSLLGNVIVNRAKPSERQKSKYTTKEEALQIQTHRSELLILCAPSNHVATTATSASSSSSSSSSASGEEEMDHRKKDKKDKKDKKVKKEKKDKKKDKKKKKEGRERGEKKRVNEERMETIDQNKRIKLEVTPVVEEMAIEQRYLKEPEVKMEPIGEMEVEEKENKQRMDDWWIENMVERGLL